MTDTIATAQPSPAELAVSDWLDQFNAALAAKDARRRREPVRRHELLA